METGTVPAKSILITCAIDLGKYLAHWVVVAWFENATSHVVDYGRLEIPSDDLGVEQALLLALREFREQIQAGWPIEENTGKTMVPGQVWIDAGYMTDIVYQFCTESGRRALHFSTGVYSNLTTRERTARE